MCESPPSLEELSRAADSLGLKKLLNTSGMDYRSLGLKDLLPTLTKSDVIQMLNQNGNLVKRPLVFSDAGEINGFQESAWLDFFHQSE